MLVLRVLAATGLAGAGLAGTVALGLGAMIMVVVVAVEVVVVVVVVLLVVVEEVVGAAVVVVILRLETAGACSWAAGSIWVTLRASWPALSAVRVGLFFAGPEGPNGRAGGQYQKSE